jgi:hypothetical protein
MSPRAVAKVLAYGRLAIGAGMVALPGQTARVWVGSEGTDVAVVTRALGAREVLLGFLTAHVVDRKGVGARTVQAVALMDAVDFATTLAARERLPTFGVVTVGAMAGGSFIAGIWAGRNLPH